MDSTRKKTLPRSHEQIRFFTARSLFLFSLVAFICLLSNCLRIFHPVLIASTISLHSHSSAISTFRISDHDATLPSLRVHHRVLFPDHILAMASRITGSGNLECIYHEKLGSVRLKRKPKSSGVLFKSALSVDEYNERISIVTCPLPPPNYSAAVDLRREDGKMYLLSRETTVNSWEALAYAAQVDDDDDTVVVFVKGLNLRPGRERDPNRFLCHFRTGNQINVSRAITAAQEVIRCAFPSSIPNNSKKEQGFGVSISKTLAHKPLPSIAEILRTQPYEKKHQEKHELCVCTMVWNQASSLREWIIYHTWLGVERWFIYDNNSNDSIKDVIEQIRKENYNVTRHPWPWIKTQEAGFSHCALRARHECRWVGFIDVDEFFYFPFSNTLDYPLSLKMLVSNITAVSPETAEIRTACHSYGPSGLSSSPSRGVTVGYTCRVQRPERHKSIVRPDALDVTLLNVVHHFRIRRGFRYLNLPPNRCVVNHYKYQVWESFSAKFSRRVATYVVDWQENQNEGSRDRVPGLGTQAIEPSNWRLQFCEVWDTGLRDFVLTNLADPITGLLPWQEILQEHISNTLSKRYVN